MSAKHRGTPEQHRDNKVDVPGKVRKLRGKSQEDIENIPKAERQRMEREQRIRDLQSKGGGKKPIKTGPKRSSKVIGWIVGIAAALALLVWLLSAIGVPQRFLPAMRVGNENVSILEYNYYYNSLVSFYQQSLGGQTIDMDGTALYSEEEETWGEFFARMAEASIQETYILADKAEEAGFTGTEEGSASVDQYFIDLAEQTGGQVEMELYLEGVYGKGASSSTLRPIMEQQRVASEYSNEIPAGYSFTDEEVEARYEEDTGAYDLVDYHMFSMRADTTVAEGETPLTDEEKADRMDEVRELAESAVEDLDDPEDFETVADEYRDQLQALQLASKADEVAAGADEEDEEEDPDEEDVDRTFYASRGRTSIYPNSVAEWLFDDEREENDTAFFEEGELFYVLQFLERKQDTRPVPDVRFTLFPASLYEGANEEMQHAALAAAESLLEKIDNEDDLLAIDAALEDGSYKGEEVENTDDETDETETVTIKPQPSALVEDLTPTTGLEQAVSGWAIDSEREVGDVTAVQGNYGSYVAVISDIDEDETQQTYQIRFMLAQEKYRDDMEVWRNQDDYQLERVQPGYWIAN